jgi:hypothetical protein
VPSRVGDRRSASGDEELSVVDLALLGHYAWRHPFRQRIDLDLSAELSHSTSLGSEDAEAAARLRAISYDHSGTREVTRSRHACYP